MATLVTQGDRLLTTTGRPSWLSTPSVPLASYGRDTVPIGTDGALLSFLGIYDTQPWIAAAVNKLSRGIMGLPLRLYREVTTDGEVEPVYNHPVMDLILKPWERGSASNLKQKMTFPALIHGNSVLGKVRPDANSAPDGFVPLDWRFLTAYMLEDGEVFFWETTQPNRHRYWAPEDVVHFAFEAGNGDIGVSPLKQLAKTIASEDASQRYQASSFRNGARPSGAIVTPDDMNDDQLKRMRDAIRAAYGGGPDNQFQVALLTGGADWKPFSHTAVEAELIDQRKLNREEAAAVYDVAPPLIGILDHATYSNIKELHDRFYITTLGPWLTLIADTLTAQLIDSEPAWADGGLFLAFDLSEVLRRDTPEEIAAVVGSIAGGVMTPNEGRNRLRMRKFDEDAADDLYLPMNNLTALGTPPPEPPQAPQLPPGPPESPSNGNPADPVKANLHRAMERAAKRMSAGQDPWDRARFVRELKQDAPFAPVEPLADLVEGLISRSEGDPAECRRLSAARF